MVAGTGQRQPGRSDRRSERLPSPASGSGPSRTDVGVPVHLLSGDGHGDGRRSGGHAGDRCPHPDLWDAHISNFGAYASPERTQVFDLNDFDETLPGPWEWDVKRLAASVVLAVRDIGLDESAVRTITESSIASYRKSMLEFATMPVLGVWYSMATLEVIVAAAPDKRIRSQVTKAAAKFRSKDSLHAFSKLTETVDGWVRIKSAAPLLVPIRDAPNARDELWATVERSLADYRDTLSDNRRQLLDRFRPVDVALKVVGVGSVGTRCLIVLMLGRDSDDPLFLQVKEAATSVLEDHLPPSQYPSHGRRVVEGQRLMQATSDIFLGWSETGTEHYYWRQFRDMKGSGNIAALSPKHLGDYVSLCGWTLARAHARAGDPGVIAGYLGKGRVFDKAVTEFAVSYATQAEQDFEVFSEAITSGVIEARDD